MTTCRYILDGQIHNIFRRVQILFALLDPSSKKNKTLLSFYLYNDRTREGNQ
jgi:hypothetical protein